MCWRRWWPPASDLIGYFDLVPGLRELFTTEFGRVRGTFKDPNVLGAYLVPALLYVLNVAIRKGVLKASLWVLAAPILLFASLMAFSRGAWINLAVSLLAYICFTFTTVSTHRERLKLVLYTVLAGMFAAWHFRLGADHSSRLPADGGARQPRAIL